MVYILYCTTVSIFISCVFRYEHTSRAISLFLVFLDMYLYFLCFYMSQRRFSPAQPSCSLSFLVVTLDGLVCKVYIFVILVGVFLGVV